MDDLQDWLLDLKTREGVPKLIQQDADRMLGQLARGLVPARGDIDRLWRAIQVPEPCRRLEQDGACAWVRRYAADYGLKVAPDGERAPCAFPVNFAECPGYIGGVP